MSIDDEDIALSIVIVNYNVRNLLENCLQSVYSALGTLPAEIFVVDNHSDDGSADMVRREFPAVRLIASNENLGFARANNLALRESRGRFILLLNPDTLVQEDTFSTLIAFFSDNPEAGMGGCKIINPDGSFEPACRRSFPSPWVAFTKLSGLSKLFPRTRLFARYNMTYLDEDQSYEVDAISGSFMFLRREVYESIGGLDEQYFMYGEDLDWCHRTKNAGWKVFYVHSTSIIHYGGESTNRSSIDATAYFYRAMEVFSEKNLRVSKPGLTIIRAGIKLRLLLSRSRAISRMLLPVVIDAALLTLSIFLAEYIRFGELFSLPDHAYPTIQLVSLAVTLVGMFAAGAYTAGTYRFIRAGVGIIGSFFILSSLTFFFKDFAFSRAIVLLSAGINLVLVPGYRLLWMLLRPAHSATLVTGRRTLLVGLNENTVHIIEKLKRYESNAYRLAGIINTSNLRLGELVHGVPIIGNIDNIAKVIRQQNISDVIFVPDVLTYGQILSLISRTRGLSIHYRIVPKSLEFIVGKAHIDQLMSIPLVELDYNLLRTQNRVLKRTMDLAIGLPCLIAFFPFVYFLRSRASKPCSFAWFLNRLPSLVAGSCTLVGYPPWLEAPPEVYLGKPGITGLAQLRGLGSDDCDETVSLSIQYVRNQSVFLDVEILVRTIVFCLSQKRIQTQNWSDAFNEREPFHHNDH